MTGNIETGQYMEQCGYGMPIDIVHALNRQASQENCDGDPYDAMVFAGEYITALRAEITKLRAELERERELADRLAAQLDIDRHIVAEAAMTGFNYNDGDWPDRLFANNGAITRHLTEHSTRRNK